MRLAHACAALVAAFVLGCGGTQPLTPSPNSDDSADLGTAPPVDAAEATDAAAQPADLAGAPPDLAKPPAPAKKVLPFVWQGEQDYYMCGPSAARMALSAHAKALPTQPELADYMGTTTNGTDEIGLVRGALDHYLAINAYKETDLPDDPPTAAQQSALEQHLVASIDAGYALVANVVSGWRPPFYPGGTIYHYVAVIGYDAGGAKALIADPAATGCGNGECGNPSSVWYQTPKSYWIDTSDLGVWIAEKGYTWHP
jgi:hypothetical protein